MNNFLYKHGNEYLKGLDIQKTFWESLLISMNNAMVKVSTIHSSVMFKVQDTETLWTLFLQLQKLWLFSGVTLTVTEAQLYYMKHFCGHEVPVLWTSFEFTWCSFFICNRPLSHGGHFVSGDLESFVYAQLASFSLWGYPCINKAFYISWDKMATAWQWTIPCLKRPQGTSTTGEPDSGIQFNVVRMPVILIHIVAIKWYHLNVQNRLLLVSEPWIQCIRKFENNTEMQGFQYRLARTTGETCWLH